MDDGRISGIEIESGDGGSSGNGGTSHGDDAGNGAGRPRGKGGRPRKDGSPAQPRIGDGNGRGKPLNTGRGDGRGAGNNTGDEAGENATIRPSQRSGAGNGAGRRAGGKAKKATSHNLNRSLFKLVNSRLAKLETRLQVSGLVFSDDEQAEWKEAWEGFAEHWLPDMPEIDPKWAAAAAMVWACYNLGAPRLEIAVAAKRRAAAGKAAPPGDGPVVDGQLEPASAGGPVASPEGAYTAEIFRPFGES